MNQTVETHMELIEMLIFENLDSHWTQTQFGRVKISKTGSLVTAFLKEFTNPDSLNSRRFFN